MELVSNAIAFAAKAHDGMRRKGTGRPFILHPVEVAAIVGTMTGDPEAIAAAVLHDVIEDTPVTADVIREAFGDRVLELVMSETEDKRHHLPASDTWRIRKEESIAMLKQCTDIQVKMLYLGDKLANLRSMRMELAEQGDAFWQCMNQKDPMEHKWYYASIAEATLELSDTFAWQEYNQLIQEIFD